MSRIATGVLVIGALLLLWFALPDPKPQAPSEETSSCAIRDLDGLGDFGEHFLDDPGHCLQELLTGAAAQQGTWKVGVWSLQNGQWTPSGEPSMILAQQEYSAQAISEASDTPWTLRVLDKDDRTVYESTIATGDFAVLRFEYRDLPGADTVQVLRSGAVHHQEVY